MRLHHPFVCYAFILLLTIPSTFAETLLKEDWESYAEGDVPSASWKLYTGTPPGSAGGATVVEVASPFGGSRSLLLEGQVTGVAGPALALQFDNPTTKPITVKFDFHIPSTKGTGILPTMSLSDSEKNRGLKFSMVNCFLAPNQAPQIGIEGEDFSKGEILAPFMMDTWYHVEITTHEAAGGGKSFDVVITPFGKEPISQTDLKFTPKMVDFAGISFGWNSDNSKGSIYISNLVVEEVP